MASFQGNVILAYVAYAVLMIGSIVVIADTTTLKGSACNGRGIELVSNYARARDFALGQAVEHTPETGYNYHGGSRYMSAIAYSHGQCSGELVILGCERCMTVVRRYMIMYCATNTEGWVQLEDCFISFWEFPIK